MPAARIAAGRGTAKARNGKTAAILAKNAERRSRQPRSAFTREGGRTELIRGPEARSEGRGIGVCQGAKVWSRKSKTGTGLGILVQVNRGFSDCAIPRT